jgi:lysophospholipase L1-like esterase
MVPSRALTGAVLLACLGAGVMAADAAAPVAGRSAGTPPVYLSLGDSLAAGAQPDARGVDHPTGQGYASVVGSRLAKVYPGLQTRRLSCGGARTGSLMTGGAGCQREGEPGQLVQAERIMASEAVPLVTVNIGDNDVESCLGVNPPSVDTACVSRGRAEVARNLPLIARRLKAAAGPHTAVVGILDYDQFLALYLDGPDGRRVARRSVRIIGSLNALMASIYRRAGVLVADAGPRFATTDLRTHRRGIPLAVERICSWTWACSPAPIGHDDHAKPHGYRVIAQAVLDALRRSS